MTAQEAIIKTMHLLRSNIITFDMPNIDIIEIVMSDAQNTKISTNKKEKK